MTNEIVTLLLFIFTLSIFLGFELIIKVPSTLHTPLMSATNAISGITLIGALSVMTHSNISRGTLILGLISILFSTINVVGGYLITHRMLQMFETSQNKEKKQK